MPYGLVLEESNDFDDRINNVTNFYYWCASRMLTLDRTYAKEILNSIGASQSVTDRERAQLFCRIGSILPFADGSAGRYGAFSGNSLRVP